MIELKHTKQLLLDWGEDVKREMAMFLDFTQNLKNNIVVKYDDNTESLKLSMPGYAIFVDKGRKPGKMPPLQNISDWCDSRGIDNKFAFPIARKIGEQGIEARPFLNIFKDKVPELIAKLKESISEDINISA